MNDSVREELETKIGRVSGPLVPSKADPPKAHSTSAEKPFQQQPVMPRPVVPDVPPKPVVASPTPRAFTGEIGIKKTSPTLVDFQPKKPTVPDWRLQLQNSVRQRSSGNRAVAVQADAVSEAVLATAEQPAINAALELTKETSAVSSAVKQPSNERVANALKRIEASRKTHMPFDQTPSQIPVAAPAVPKRERPFNVVAKNSASTESAVRSTQFVEQDQAAEPRQKPRLVSSLRIEKRGYDTNKLTPIPQPAALTSSFEINISNRKSGTLEIPDTDAAEVDNIRIEEITPDHIQANNEEMDDLAPFSLRLASGLFDVSLAAMASVVILSPLMAGAESWLTMSGVLLFTATLAIILFLYLTASVSFWGRSFGMKLFSLELIDAEENVYPTLHQSAVSSAVFLLSLATVGLGFITILFTEEKRAVHDIVSGTLIIRDI